MAELVWEGKYRDGKRVAPVRLALPFQTVETVNESAQDRMRTLDLFASGKPAAWRNRLIWGDKKYVLPSLLPEFAGKVNLIYIDPPFRTEDNFTIKTEVPDTDAEIVKRPSMIEQKAYRDTWSNGLDSYLPWFYDTAVLLRELLADTGSIFVHLDVHTGPYVKALMDEVFGQENFQNEIAWYYYNKMHDSRKRALPKAFDQILYYVKSKQAPYKYHRLEEDRDAPVKQLKRIKVDGKMVNARDEDGKVMYQERTTRVVDNVWRIRQLQPANKAEWVNYETQKPVDLIQRALEVASDPGDLVLDCFCGSGTTLVASELLGRRWIGCDLGRFAIHTTRKRLLGVPDVKPFIVQNLGKYERQAWMAAEFARPEDRAATEAAYRRFILDLFHAEPLTGNAWLHGVKSGRMVHVGAVDAPITIADVKAISREVWRAAGAKGDGAEMAAVDILGWEFAFELNETAKQIAAESRVDVKFRRIPREVLEKAAVDQGDIQARDFFELRALSTKVTKNKRAVTVELTDFMLPAEDLPDDVAKAVKHWSQWIDYWAVDWDFKGDTFHNQWQSFRTRQDGDLELKVESPQYKEPGKYTIVVKVIDILGNDTTKSIEVEVK